MAGTLTISTLSDGTNSTSSTNCIQGSAKAWVNFNGTAATIRASYNVSSITKNGTGDWSMNFTSAMSDANYSLIVSAAGGSNGSTVTFPMLYNYNDGTYRAVSTYGRFLLQGSGGGGGTTDSVYCCAAVFR